MLNSVLWVLFKQLKQKFSLKNDVIITS